MQEKVSEARPDLNRWSYVPYVAPMAVYLLFTQAESLIPEARMLQWYPIAYVIKAIATAVTLIACRSIWTDLKARPGPLGWIVSVLVGLGITVIWVGSDGLYPPLPFVGGERQAFDPNELSTVAKWWFLSARFFGLVVLVPVFEELFWRSFMMRLIIDPDDFRRVPIGAITPFAVAVTAVGFMLVHPEWLPALVTGAVWAGLLGWTRSVSACVLSHFVANLALGIYVLLTGSWHFW